MKLRVWFLVPLVIFFHLSSSTASRPPVLGGAQAQFPETLDGNELLAKCNLLIRAVDGEDIRADENPSDGFWCIGYLSGFTDGYVLSTTLSKKGRSPVYCPPDAGIRADQMARIVTKWLKDNPEHLHESGRISTLIALGRAFPCS